MKKTVSLMGMLALAAALILAPAPAKAAMWVGIEAGLNWMGNNDIKWSQSNGASFALNNYKWDTKVLGGVTFGYHFVNSGFLAYNWPDWMKYFQFAIDFSFTTIEAGPKSFFFPPQLDLGISRLKGDVFTVAFLFIGCYGFYPDSVAPFGRVIPYIGVGPALVQSWLQGGYNIGRAEKASFNESSTDIALCAEAGVRYMALKNVSLDVAFRYRWLQPNYTFPRPGEFSALGNNNLGIKDANLFNVLFRASYHF